MLDVDRANMLDVALWSLTEFFAKSHRQSQICEAGLVGSGGAGKSKMINALLGEPAPFQDGERDPAVVGVHPRDAELGAACFLNARFRAYRPSVGRRQGLFRFVSYRVCGRAGVGALGQRALARTAAPEVCQTFLPAVHLSTIMDRKR